MSVYPSHWVTVRTNILLLLILLAGLDQSQLVYSVSMTFRSNRTSGREVAIGYLDDLLIISFGITDKTSHFIEATVDEILKDHDLCSDLMSGNITFDGPPQGIVL